MRRLRRLALAATFGAVLGASACSGDPGTDAGPAPAPAPTDASNAATSVPEQTGTPAPSASPVDTMATEQCLTGRYALVRFVAVGDGSTYGTGQGGDVEVAFDDGRYTLAGAGREPVVVTLAGQTGNLTVDGESTGTYGLDGATATFTPGSATGGGTLGASSGGDRTKLTMKQVDAVIGLAGDSQVACTDQVMTITLPAIRLELARA